jgi:fructokinase
MGKNRIGIDLGGTKIEILVLAPDGTEAYRERAPTPRDYDASIDAIASLVAKAERETGEGATVGLGIPGSPSPVTGTIRNANSTWLNGRDLAGDLATVLDRPVRLANDANCFALSEACDGAGRSAESVFGVILGTGVGGGLVVDKRILPGSQGIAGEWGHNPLPWPSDRERPGRACYCGRLGCIETFLSGPGLKSDHTEATGRDWEPEVIGRRASTGDLGARLALGRYISRLARSLATVINLADPEVVVLGGGVSNIPGLAVRVQDALEPFVFTDQVLTRVVRNLHGDSSGVRGAAWLWPAGRAEEA